MANFPGQTASLLDRGVTSIEGVSLRHLTVEYFATNAKAKTKESVATDLYFDPVSQLLVKSASSIRLNGVSSPFSSGNHIRGLRLVSGSMVPFRFTQTLDGQLQWTLQLMEVELNPAFKPNIFPILRTTRETHCFFVLSVYPLPSCVRQHGESATVNLR